MFNNQRKNICVILCDVADHYQEQVCCVLTSNARVKGYNLAYFSFFLTYGVDTKNGRGEANIINLIPYENFDGFKTKRRSDKSFNISKSGPVCRS